MSSPATRRPTDREFAAPYASYVALVPDGDLLQTLERQAQDTAALLRGVGEAKSEFRYAPDKWSIREVVSHVLDSERVFSYRALRFARGDATPLPGYDEKHWGATTNAHRRALAALIDELALVRAATVALFRGFDDAAWDRAGVANAFPVTVRALGWIIAGHERHHVKILQERYLSP